MGDEMDRQIQEKIEKAMKELITRQSIWDVGYSQFSGVCQGILTSCQVNTFPWQRNTYHD